MNEDSHHAGRVEELWRNFLEKGEFEKETRNRRLFRMLPTEPRCKFCNAPFHGLGSTLVRILYGRRPSNLNPRMCNTCERFAGDYIGGAEIELSMLFADVRGSTTLAEDMGTAEFSKLIGRFYGAATKVLIHSDALIDKLIGDEVTGLYVPGFAGPDHARTAIEAARELLMATGHGDPEGPWVPVGASVHTGVAFVGAVGSADGVTDITTLGDAPNTAARLASMASRGEIIISEDAARAAGLDAVGLERRELRLKGRSKPVKVRIISIVARAS